MSLGRRAFLAGNLAFVASFAGCSTFVGEFAQSDENAGPPPLHEVKLSNKDGESHGVYLLVQRNGEIVHWQRHDIPSETSQEEGEIPGITVLIESPAWPGCGSYDLMARLDGETEQTRLNLGEQEFTYNPGEPRQVTVDITTDRTISMRTAAVALSVDCEETTE